MVSLTERGLKDCILDFGPMYSFWLFAFERLNGVIGSYHTNCHDISLQLMRCFLSSSVYGIHNWPQEYKEELVPLVSHHHYQKGSLRSTSLEQALHQYHSETIDPLPPVREVAWASHQKQALCDFVLALLGHNNFSLLGLYEKSSALLVGGFVIGSKSSRHVTKLNHM